LEVDMHGPNGITDFDQGGGYNRCYKACHHLCKFIVADQYAATYLERRGTSAPTKLDDAAFRYQGKRVRYGEEMNGGMFLVYWTPDESGLGFAGPGYAHADETVKKYMPSIAVYSSPWWRTISPPPYLLFSS
jgi:hypothetical protein